MKHRFVCACALSLVACGGSALDVGSNSGGSSGSSAEGGSDSGGSSHAFGGDVAVGGARAASGGEAAMGARAATGGTPSTGTAAAGGDPAMGARAATGGEAAMGARAATGGEAAMGARAATGGKPSTGTPTTGGQMPVGMGGATSTAGTGGAPNELVPQTCPPPGANPNNVLIAGVWEGSTLDFFFNPLDDRWRIEITGSDLATGRVCGTATYLAAGQPAPPPATDPDASYPPGADPIKGGFGGAGMGGATGAWPGATYSIIQGAEVGGVLRFRLAGSELWKDWCALQTPVPQGDGYGCIGGENGWSSDGVTCTMVNADGSTQTSSVAKCNLCSGTAVCTCDAAHCVASDQGTSIVFDLKDDGVSKLTGTVDGTMITLDRVQ